ncbi:MAG TPA: FRG domain-containing protein [Ferruginibacter sp.]|nr:FRG domain-containing protein [Ferruginibacter sp.]
MRKPVKNISTISDLLKNLKKDAAEYKGQIWFRGQSAFDWKLQPAFLRKEKNITEFTLITKFRQNASLLIEKSPSNYFDWLFQMQHHGVPTRLLDWTESALTALYFAVEDGRNQNKDGALWILLPTELNKNANIYSDEIFYIPSFEDIVLKNYNPEVFHQEKNTKLLPVAAIASRNNSRMQAQLGVFTISHRDKTPIENIGDKKHIWKYKIPRANKKMIKLELSLLGITKFQVFPELSSIGEIINKEF